MLPVVIMRVMQEVAMIQTPSIIPSLLPRIKQCGQRQVKENRFLKCSTSRVGNVRDKTKVLLSISLNYYHYYCFFLYTTREQNLLILPKVNLKHCSRHTPAGPS